MRGSWIKGAACFAAGFAAAALLAGILFWSPEAMAVNACMRNDLRVIGYRGEWGDEKVKLVYAVPDCIFQAGYQVDSVWVNGGTQVRMFIKK